MKSFCYGNDLTWTQMYRQPFVLEFQPNYMQANILHYFKCIDLLNNIISLENDKYKSLLKTFIDQIKIWHHLMTFQQPTTIRPNNNLYISPLFPTSPLLSPNLHPSPLPSLLFFPPHISSYLLSSPLLHLAQMSAATLKCLADDVAGIGSGIMSFMLSLKYHTLSPGKPMEG